MANAGIFGRRQKFGRLLEYAEQIAMRVTNKHGRLTVESVDGRTFSAPLTWYAWLSHAEAQECSSWRLIGQGEGVYWPELNEDISPENILLGKPSGESQRSLKRWL